jgi:predicted house-cleaning noncanonical NTP pyrophosphatase (MazG superfamily)
MKKIFLCDKLVRDKTQQKYHAQGIDGVYRVLSSAERCDYARKKVLEEAQEALAEMQAGHLAHAVSELSDVIQAAQAILELKQEAHMDLFSSAILATFLKSPEKNKESETIAEQLMQNAHNLQQSTAPSLERDTLNVCFIAIRLAKSLGYNLESFKQVFEKKQEEKGSFQTWTCLSQITLPEDNPKFQAYAKRYPMLDTLE